MGWVRAKQCKGIATPPISRARSLGDNVPSPDPRTGPQASRESVSTPRRDHGITGAHEPALHGAGKLCRPAAAAAPLRLPAADSGILQAGQWKSLKEQDSLISLIQHLTTESSEGGVTVNVRHGFQLAEQMIRDHIQSKATDPEKETELQR